MDQLRLDALGCYGNSMIRTPNIDRIAEKGVRFDNFFVQSPQCMSSRACLLTGMYPRANGLRRYGQSLSSEVPTVSGILSMNSYHTAIFGKTHFYWEGDDLSQEPEYGFDTYCDYREKYTNYKKSIVSEDEIERVRYNKKQRSQSEPFSNPLPEEATCDYWTTIKTKEFLQNYDDEKPFMAWVSYIKPHHPFNPPERFVGLYDESDMPVPAIREDEYESWQHKFMKSHWVPDWYQDFSELGEKGYQKLYTYYYSMITMIDEYIGSILDDLNVSGHADNTMIVFTSDHGDMMGDHGLGLKGYCHYDQLIHMPLIWYWPGHIEGGEVNKALVEEVDIAPTFMDYAGIDIPSHITGQKTRIGLQLGEQGKSIRSLLTDGKQEFREYIYAESYMDCWIKTLRSRKWNFSYYAGVNGGELYDMENDPGQFKNLWFKPEYDSIKQRLTEKLFEKVFISELFPEVP